jgi:PAS domain S-box-containing protein
MLPEHRPSAPPSGDPVALREALDRAQAELRAANQALAVQRELTERIVTTARTGLSYLNRDLVYEWVNPVQAEMWGIPAEQVVGRRVQDVFGLDEASDVVVWLRSVVETGRPWVNPDYPFTYMVDGRPRTTYWDFVYQPVHADGRVAGVLVTAVETSAQRQATEDLRESEERYRGLFEASRDAIVIGTLDRGIIDANPAFTEVFGYTLDEALGRTSAFLYPSEAEFEAVGEQVAPHGERQAMVIVETLMKRRDGTIFPVEVSSYRLWDSQGRPSHLVGVLRDLTAQKEAEARAAAYHREIAAQKAFAESLIQNVPTGIAYLDRDLIFRVANPVYANFLQIPAEQFIDRYLFDVLPADKAQVEPILLDVIETGKPFYATEYPFIYTTPQGEERTTYWDFVYYPVRRSEDEPVEGVFALADEISDRIEQQREQRQLREEQARLQQERLHALEASDRLKDEFLSILSHELRTPINAIMGFGSVLDDEIAGPLNQAQHSYTAKILSSADALLALIEDLLIVSRVQAGKFSVAPQPTGFGGLVDDALASQAPAADKKSIALVTQVPTGLPLLQADPLRLTQVINNLLSNAIKFTPPGGRVTVRAAVTDGRLRCEVTDTGIGIAEADQPKLFQRFSQLDMSSTRAASGAGLGLSIVKAIVEAHGGTIGVESQPGEGATFWFTLPLA